jgi:hypothetical protein
MSGEYRKRDAVGALILVAVGVIAVGSVLILLGGKLGFL